MDFNTSQVKDGIEQIATLLSELVVRYSKEEEHVLKIQPGEVSQGLKPLLALLGIQTSFEKAAKLAQEFLLLEISDNSIRKAAQWVGQKQQAIE